MALVELKFRPWTAKASLNIEVGDDVKPALRLRAALEIVVGEIKDGKRGYAYLSDADLRGAYLRDAYLSDADLRGADLRGAYAICLAGKAGFDLERKYGPANAGMLLYLKSTPDAPIPNWTASNADAMADIKARAKAQIAHAKGVTL